MKRLLLAALLLGCEGVSYTVGPFEVRQEPDLCRTVSYFNGVPEVCVADLTCCERVVEGRGFNCTGPSAARECLGCEEGWRNCASVK